MRYIVPYYLLFWLSFAQEHKPRSQGYGECMTSIMLGNLYSIDVSIGTLIIYVNIKSCSLGFFEICTPFIK